MAYHWKGLQQEDIQWGDCAPFLQLTPNGLNYELAYSPFYPPDKKKKKPFRVISLQQPNIIITGSICQSIQPHSLVNQITDSTEIPDWHIEGEVNTIRKLLRDYPFWTFPWTPREGNYLAPNIANWCSLNSRTGVFCCEDLPADVVNCDARALLRAPSSFNDTVFYRGKKKVQPHFYCPPQTDDIL